MPDRTPAVTPGDGVGASTVLAFLALVSVTDQPERVQLALVIGAILVSVATVIAHSNLRIARNVRATLKDVE